MPICWLAKIHNPRIMRYRNTGCIEGGRLQGMDSFLEEPLERLRGLLPDYDRFCRIAERLAWQSAKERHEDWRCTYPLGILLDAYEFPRDYKIGRASCRERV